MIRDIRTALSLSQEQFAAKLGVSVGTVHRWEAGKYKPSRMAEHSLRQFLCLVALPDFYTKRFKQLRAKAGTTLKYARIKAERTNGAEVAPPICADCGAKAEAHDHRDYYKPLAVEPVCRSCNYKRGRAVDTLFHPEFWKP